MGGDDQGERRELGLNRGSIPYSGSPPVLGLGSVPVACYGALSPCGRGQLKTFNKHNGVRAWGLTPHPIRSVEPSSSPLPQGERAQRRAPSLRRRRLQISIS